MANIWRKDDNVKEQPKRNIMDLSFQNNLTTQFGKLVPVFCKEFIPGDSFSIKPTFSLKFQPMVFPIQTRMRAHLHFFKVRNRNLWKDWEDFIAKNKENLDPPYLDTSVTKPTTGSLLDYLGVPTTITGSYGRLEELVVLDTVLNTAPFVSTSAASSGYASMQTYSETPSFDISILNVADPDGDGWLCQSTVFSTPPSDVSEIRVQLDLREVLPLNAQIDDFLNYKSPTTSPLARRDNIQLLFVYTDNTKHRVYPKYPCANNGLLIYDCSSIDMSLVSTSYVLITPVQKDSVVDPSTGYTSSAYMDLDNSVSSGSAVITRLPQYFTIDSVSYQIAGADSSVSDIDDSNSPYWRSGATIDLRERIKLSALPCRAYEQIYNSFYRNAENNPYILNGVPEYNKYMPTDEGGVDANLYDFYYRNWEDDFLTTALQQPQAGIAPLVGLTGTAGTATITLADEDGNTSEATASYDEEGNVTSVAFANNTSLTEALADAVQYGISINDLRNVNAFQRWLEAKARGGYKYRDVIETMFGISVRYDTLDMPEFIGGTSIDIMVNQISQTVPTESSPLGDYAGQAAGIGTGQTINEYFDEHGFVIGILSVVPVPNYSQLLPKHFIKRDAFDYYFPQFGHIGMQPIKYDEVCPVQAYQDSTDQNNVLDETFGYQRAWYDYLASTDEVHGEFRTNLRNFVMNRTFDTKPELVKEFLTVDPSQLNDVFAIQDDSYDKILGQIYFDVKAKRPIPLYGIPKLE